MSSIIVQPQDALGSAILCGARFIEVQAEVRYWDDALLNDRVDFAGEMPLRRGALWAPIIELETGRLQAWPEDTRAEVHYKVCDAGEYWLLDERRVRIAKWKGHYVPDQILSTEDHKCGDYIILKIGGDGLVIGWNTPTLQVDRWVAIGALSADSTKR